MDVLDGEAEVADNRNGVGFHGAGPVHEGVPQGSCRPQKNHWSVFSMDRAIAVRRTSVG